MAAGRWAIKPVLEARYDPLPSPAILVSYFYWRLYMADRASYIFRDYALDSGAFSAHNSGKIIELDAYAEFAAERLATDKQCAEVFTLDVIGDWRASMRNTHKLWERGIPATPIYHVGEPESVLIGMAREYPRIALGGAVRMEARAKHAFAKACFAKVWPARIHGLGFAAEGTMMAVPFSSVDATNWATDPAMYGRWKAFGGKVSVRGHQNLRAEAEWYLRLEQRLKMRWARRLGELDELPAYDRKVSA